MEQHLRGTRPLLGEIFAEPPGPPVRPRAAAAEIGWSDRTWWPCTVIAWKRLPPERDIITGRMTEWAVRLRLGDGTEGWYAYDPAGLRAAR